MKIYVDNLDMRDFKKIKILDSCIKKTAEFFLLYTQEGIFRIDSGTNNMQKMNFIDKHCEHIQIKEWKCIVDHSNTEYISEIYQIPILYSTEKIIEETYTLRDKSPLKFVVLKYDNLLLRDFYFICHEDIKNELIQEDFLSFLSDIN
jgi:hypothetical protein